MSTELTQAEREALARQVTANWTQVKTAATQGLPIAVVREVVTAIARILAARLAAQREQIAEEIEALHPIEDCPACNYGHGLRDAARIARGIA